MVHPLNQTIDVSFHLPKTETRRRSSLDNSALLMSSLEDSFMALLPDDEKAEFEKKERRLSLDNKLESMNTTFLADIEFATKQPKGDLDSDWHSSLHSTNNGTFHKQGTSSRKQSTHSKTSQQETIKTSSIKSSSYSSDGDRVAEIDEMSSSSSSSSDADSFGDDSDCDSFCDASISEPANRNYLRRDLGASVAWDDNSIDGFSFTSSFTGSDAGDHVYPLDSPPGKPQRTVSGKILPGSPAPFSRPPLRSTSSGSSISLLGSTRQLRRGGRRRDISAEQLDEEE